MKKFEYYLEKQECESTLKEFCEFYKRSDRKWNKEMNSNRRAAFLFVFPIIVAIIVCFLLFCFKGNEKNVESEECAIIIDDGSIFGDDVEASGYASIELLRENTSFVDPEIKYSNSAVFKVTHYCGCSKCCGKWSGNSESKAIGAAGTELKPYKSVAVDKELIPFGTKFYDTQGNEYIAEDTGSGVKGYHIDLFVGNHEEALNFGVKTIELYW